VETAREQNGQIAKAVRIRTQPPLKPRRPTHNSTAMRSLNPHRSQRTIHLPKMQKSHPHSSLQAAGPPAFIPPPATPPNTAPFPRVFRAPRPPYRVDPPPTDWLSLIDSASSPVASRHRGPRNHWSGAVGVAVWVLLSVAREGPHDAAGVGNARAGAGVVHCFVSHCGHWILEGGAGDGDGDGKGEGLGRGIGGSSGRVLWMCR